MVEQNECYICTDPTEEKSPCECAHPVHMKCLLQWVKKNNNMGVTCSICHTTLEGIEPPQRKEETPSLPLIDSPRPFRCLVRTWRMSYLNLLFFFGCGYIGKFIFAALYEPTWLNIDDYWTPFDLIFLVCALSVSFFIVGWLKCLLKIHAYISRNDSNNYEEFRDSDSDSDDTELSIV